MNLLTKAFAIVLCVCLCASLSACDKGSNMSNYDEGYYAGYEAGLLAGASEAREDLAREAWDQYQAMEGQTTKERGLHPEEAIIVLNEYLDGKYVSAEEIRTAIRSITYFYYHAWDVIKNIKYMEVYFD